MTVLRYGETAGREVSKRIAAPVANLATLSGFGTADAADGQVAIDLSTKKLWGFSAASVVTADNVLAAGAGTVGRWLLLPGKQLLQFPITFATANAALLWTIPTGAVLCFRSLFWGITADFTGGASSAIGVSSTRTNFTTPGDLLGGAAGDVAATLVAASVYTPGTIGAKIDALSSVELNAVWTATQTLRFDRITSAFTAGTGTVNLVADLLLNPGA